MRAIQGKEIEVLGSFAASGVAGHRLEAGDTGIYLGQVEGELHNLMIKRRSGENMDAAVFICFHEINFSYTGKYAVYRNNRFLTIEKPQRKSYIRKDKKSKAPIRAVRV